MDPLKTCLNVESKTDWSPEGFPLTLTFDESSKVLLNCQGWGTGNASWISQSSSYIFLLKFPFMPLHTYSINLCLNSACKINLYMNKQTVIKMPHRMILKAAKALVYDKRGRGTNSWRVLIQILTKLKLMMKIDFDHGSFGNKTSK